MQSLRTKPTENAYKKYREKNPGAPCFLCNKKIQQVVKKFKYFVIVENHFPYDAVASESLIIFPKRHVTESELTPEEQAEFTKLKTANKFVRSFDYILTGLAKTSIPAHFHAHLVKLKHR